jgi:hypothetical protein
LARPCTARRHRPGRHPRRHRHPDAPGDTIWTRPGEEHWHGATAGNLTCHFAMLEGDGTSDGTTWLEPVTDQQYQAAHGD